MSGSFVGLSRAGNKHSRPPSEAGCINVTAFRPSGTGKRLPAPEKPTEHLGLPVSMDGTLWTLCARYSSVRFCRIDCVNPPRRLTDSEMVIGEPSPHAAEIGRMGWKQFATMCFNYRTEGEIFAVRGYLFRGSLWRVDELSSGRIRRSNMPLKQESPSGMSTFSSPWKRKRESSSDSVSRKRQDWSSASTTLKARVSITMGNSFSSGASDHPQSSEDTVRVVRSLRPLPVKSYLEQLSPEPEPSSPFTTWTPSSPQANSDTSDRPPRKPTSPPLMEPSPTNPSATKSVVLSMGPKIPRIPRVPRIKLRPSLPSPQSQPQHSAVAPAITSPSIPHDSPEPEQPIAASLSEADRAVIALTKFLDETSSFRPLGLSAKDLQEAGISTLGELKIIARKPEVFRTKIPVLANLHEHDRYLWMMFRKGLKKLLEEDHGEQLAGDLIHESDPAGKFVHSMDGRECIDSEALANGLRGAGISSEKDLLVLSRNLEKYTKNIPFLREFAASKRFAWMVFQVGLEGLPGGKIPASIPSQDREAVGEGRAFVKWFLDTIDADKPLGYLGDGFIKEGLDARIPLLHVAEDIELAVDSIPFLQGLASGDQLVWAMILVGLEDLMKSA